MEIDLKSWTVRPFLAPRDEADPLGVFVIEEIQRDAETHDEAARHAAPESAEEQAALDKRDALTESARRLIAAAPELLAALEAAAEALRNVPCVGEIYDRQHSDTHLAAEVAARAAIAKATGG